MTCCFILNEGQNELLVGKRPASSQPVNLCEFKLLLLLPGCSNQILTTVKAVASCIEISQSYPFHFNSQLLNHASVGISHDGFLFK